MKRVHKVRAEKYLSKMERVPARHSPDFDMLDTCKGSGLLDAIKDMLNGVTPIRPLQFNYLSYELFGKNPVRLQIKKKKKKSTLVPYGQK